MDCVSLYRAEIFKYNLKLLFDCIWSAVKNLKSVNDTTDATKKVCTLESVEKAMNNYGNAVLRLAYSYLHNMSDAEDVLQDTLIKYIEAAPNFKSREHEKAWLLRVASNLSKNKLDYNKVRETDELEESLIAQENENLSFVWEAVKSLPEKYREVIHLYYQEGYKTREISKILKRKESSIRSDLKRGREQLKDILKEAYDFE